MYIGAAFIPFNISMVYSEILHGRNCKLFEFVFGDGFYIKSLTFDVYIDCYKWAIVQGTKIKGPGNWSLECFQRKKKSFKGPKIGIFHFRVNATYIQGT